MAKGRQIYLLTYDIADDARLRHVAGIAERYGVRLQYSVFLAELAETAREELLAALAAAISPREDDVRLYPLPSEPCWELHGTALWPEGVMLSGTWPEEAHPDLVEEAERDCPAPDDASPNS